MKLECDKFAVMLIRNAYDYSKVVIRDVSYLRDIEADLLIECCQFGEVTSLFLLMHNIFSVLTIIIPFQLMTGKECNYSI